MKFDFYLNERPAIYSLSQNVRSSMLFLEIELMSHWLTFYVHILVYFYGNAVLNGLFGEQYSKKAYLIFHQFFYTLCRCVYVDISDSKKVVLLQNSFEVLRLPNQNKTNYWHNIQHKTVLH